MATTPAAVMQVIVTANTAGANAALAKTQAQLKGTAAASTTMGSRVAKGAKAGVVGVAALGAVSTKLAIDFDKAMRNVNSIAQLPEKQLAQLSERVRDLGGKTAQSPQTLAEGLYDLVSSGFDAKESMTVLKSSANAATAGLTDTATSTKAVAAALNAYRLPASKAGKVSDIMFRTVDRGVISFETLAGSIGNALPASAALGVKLDALGAAVATLTKQGQSGESAIVNINAAMTSLFKPTEDMKAAIKELGFENAEALIQAKGFQGGLQALVDTTDGTTASVGKLFSNIRSQRAVFGLTGKNAEGAAKDLKGLEDSAGATSKALSQQSQSVAFMWNKLKAQAEDMAIGIGNNVLPVLKELITTISSDKLSSDEKITKIMQTIEDSIKEAGPKVAEAAGRIGLSIVRGVVNAFMESDALGKLFIGAAALRLFGGPAVFTTLGASMAKWLFAGFLTSAGAGAGGAGAGAAAGGLMAGIRTLLPRAGLIGLGVFAGGALMKGISDGIARSSGDVQESLDAIIPDQGGLMSSIMNFDGPGIIESIFGGSEETQHAKWIKDTLAHILNDKVGISEETKAEIMRQGKLIGLTDTQLEQASKIADYGVKRLHQAEQLNDVFKGLNLNLSGQDLLPQATVDEVTARIQQMRKGMFTTVGQIANVMKQNRQNIRSLDLPAKKTGQMLGENMRSGARAMQKALKDGSIKGVKHIRDARQQIKRLLKSADLVEGIRPRDFGDQFAKAIAKGRGATKDGIDKIVNDMMRMPKDARNAAFDTMMAQLREYKKGGQLSDKQFKDIRAKLLVRLKGITSDGKNQSSLLKSIMGGNFGDLAGTIYKGLQNIGSNVGKVFSSFEINWKKFSLQAPGGGGGKNKRAKGGMVPGYGSGDTVPLHVGGVHMADVEPNEYVSVANRNATQALMAANALVPRYAKGGTIGGDIGGLHSSVLGVLNNLFARFGGTVSSGQRPGTLHQTGQAADYVPGDWSGAARAVNSIGQSLLEGIYNGAMGGPPVSWDTFKQVPPSFWGSATWGDHGDHIHIAVPDGAKVGAMAEAFKRLKAPQLNGPEGPTRDLGQKIFDDATQAANKFIQSKMPRVGAEGYLAGGGGPVVMQMARILAANAFNAVGASGVIGNAWRESHYDPGAVGTGGGGLFGFTTSPVSLADLQSFANKSNKPWTDVGLQMQFMLNHMDSSVRSAVNNAGSPSAAAERFMTLWERPGIPALDERQAAAEQAFRQIQPIFKKGGQRLKRGGVVDLNLSKTIGKLLAPGPQKGKPAEKYDDQEHDKKLVANVRDRIKKLTSNDKFPTKDGSLQGKLAELRSKVDQYGEWAGYSADLGKPFRGQDESGWLKKQLASLFRLRNVLIKSERMVERMQRQVLKTIRDASKRQREFERRAKKGQRVLDKDGKLPKDWKGEDPIKTDVKKWNQLGSKKRLELMHKFLKQDGRLPGDRQFRDNGKLVTPETNPKAFPNVDGWNQVAGFLKNTVVGGLKGGDGTVGALRDAMSTISDELNAVQGTGLPHNVMRNLPPFGHLGGEIFGVQNSLNEISSTATSGFAIDELRSIIEAARYGVFDDQVSSEGLPRFHTGGRVPGRLGADVPVIAKGGEWFSTHQGGANGAGVEVHNTVIFNDDGVDLETRINNVLTKRETFKRNRIRQNAGGGR